MKSVEESHSADAVRWYEAFELESLRGQSFVALAYARGFLLITESQKPVQSLNGEVQWRLPTQTPFCVETIDELRELVQAQSFVVLGRKYFEQKQLTIREITLMSLLHALELGLQTLKALLIDAPEVPELKKSVFSRLISDVRADCNAPDANPVLEHPGLEPSELIKLSLNKLGGLDLIGSYLAELSGQLLRFESGFGQAHAKELESVEQFGLTMSRTARGHVKWFRGLQRETGLDLCPDTAVR